MILIEDVIFFVLAKICNFIVCWENKIFHFDRKYDFVGFTVLTENIICNFGRKFYGFDESYLDETTNVILWFW